MMTKWSWPLPDCVPWEIPRGDAPGAFGAVRDKGRHTGIDIRAHAGQPVHAVESGVVRGIGPFTEDGTATPLWQDTQAVLVEGDSGLLTYGEILVRSSLMVGDGVVAGELLGSVLPLDLPKTQAVSMLHLELYQSLETTPEIPLTWKSDEDIPEDLIDPTPYIFQAWSRVTSRFHRDGGPPPTDPEEQRELVAWLQDHNIWTHPITIKVPPEGMTFERPEESTFWERPQPDDDWVEQEVQTGSIHDCLHFDFVYVDPTTDGIEGEKFSTWDEDQRNTDFRIWVEAGGWVDISLEENVPEPDEGWNDHNRWGSCHDCDLDCGAADMQDAFLQLALRVQFFYTEEGHRRPDIPHQCEGTFEDDDEDKYRSGCCDGGDGFCSTCGFLIRYEDDKDDKETE